MKIEKFDGAYRWLSNFAPCNVFVDGRPYPTVEHAYQAAKAAWPEDAEMIRLLRTPGDAKRAGKRIRLRSEWSDPYYRRAVMLTLLRLKFAPGTDYARLLEETGDAELVEGNTWGDRFWGVCGGTGENHLGRLLMQVREENRRAP